jgi:hypothetical protein
VARPEIAAVDIAGKERTAADSPKQESAESEEPQVSAACPSPSPIGVRHPPEIRRAIEANYERTAARTRCYVSKGGCQQGRNPGLATWRLEIWRSLCVRPVTNKNDFALEEITLRCEYGTKDGPKVLFYKLSEVLEPKSMGPATISYIDHYLGRAPPVRRRCELSTRRSCRLVGGTNVQSRR